VTVRGESVDLCVDRGKVSSSCRDDLEDGLELDDDEELAEDSPLYSSRVVRDLDRCIVGM
jgi:hypothetical protein